MKRVEARSGKVESIGYDSTIRVLEVELSNGSISQYSRVPRRVWAELMESEFKGHYFDKHIRYLYPAKRLR